MNRPRHRVRSLLTLMAVAMMSLALTTARNANATTSPPAASHPLISVINYDASSLTQYHQMWTNLYGPLDNATESFSHGAFTASDVPFKPGTDFSVYDHLKYMATSDETFPAPANGSVTFSADITASSPGAVAGHVINGQYGPPGSYDSTNPLAKPYSASLLEGQQAAAVLNMIDFCTGQLFDWFVSSHSAFALIERLPSTITGNTTNPACANAPTVDLSTAYTQIIKSVPVAANVKHNVSITYAQVGQTSSVVYTIDGRVVAVIGNIGIPLDKQHVPYTGIYPSLGNGEPLAGKITSLTIGHGLFSLVDAFPFQYGCTPPSATGPGVCDPATAAKSVSISPAQRSFGQGAVGTFSQFRVITLAP